MEKVDIVFSVLAHEKAETLIDTIVNIKHYNENCGIIIHISSAFDWDGSMIDEETFYRAVGEMELVWINPQHVRSCRNILAKLHILNFDYVKKVCEFKFFSLMASNCAFIKSGVADFMSRNDYLAAFDYFNIENKGSWEWNCCLKEKQYNKLLSGINAKGAFGGQVEGSIYSFKLFEYVADQIKRYYDFEEMTDKYQSEEIIFITVAVNYLLEQGKMEYLYDDTCIYMNWHMGLRVFIIQLKSIAKKYYGVKRVPREVDADIRIYLREWWRGGGILKMYSGICDLCEKNLLLDYDSLTHVSFWLNFQRRH